MKHMSIDDLRDAVSRLTFFDLVMETSRHYQPAPDLKRQIHPPSGADFPWIMISYEGVQLPSQGWKLHVAACPVSAEQILLRVLPLLLSEGMCFKVLGSLQELEQINDGGAGLSQIGKFLTIYPHDEQEAVLLAPRLDALTRGFPAPAIPSDRPLCPGSLVSYRYGGFQYNLVQMPWGIFQTMIQTPELELIPDPRLSVYSPPDWARDPFLEAGVAQGLPEPHLLIADRYLLLTVLYRSAQSQIHLTIDLVTSQTCIVKSPGLSFIYGEEENAVCSRLCTEAQVLKALASHPAFPAFYDLCEERGRLFLVLEDIEGETLVQYLQHHYTVFGRKLPEERLLVWAQEVVSMLVALHMQGWVYYDLKASNLLVRSDGHLCLIDFGIVQPLRDELTSSALPGGGTPGYMSPQQRRGEAATVSDDIYALGALLYLLATGGEPSFAPRDVPLTVRPLRLLNPALDPALCVLIERCLHPDPIQRFTSVEEVGAALARLQLESNDHFRLQTQGLPLQSGGQGEHFRRGPQDYREMARRLGATLSQAASPDPTGNGVRWTSYHSLGKGRVARDLNAGNSGSLLALAEAVAEFDDPEQRRVLAEGARWLSTSPRLSEPPLPGLYVGEAGVGTALLRVSQVLSDQVLFERTLQQGRWVATLPYSSPDLFNGTAGRARFHLWLWGASTELEQLEAATHAGDILLAAAEQVNSTEICWRIPEGYTTMSGHVFPGYAHGVAGIADVLLDLYEATQHERFLSAAVSAAHWLERQAVPILDDVSGLSWPEKAGGKVLGSYWCHGSAGVGRFFLHAASLDVFPGALELAERAAQAVAYGNRACNPVQCHGLSGNIEYLLDITRVTEKQQYRDTAFELAELLCGFAIERDDKLLWSSESPTTFTPDYQVGYAGVLLTLLRLSDENRPHQLSLKGLSYTSM